ncbi:hypothetical protein, partial [Ureibacillus thermosphaericus]|uniref:hypothetical protein n=1 Tax=Ureibacillus thermosphaericus TaxID=51173 RepID=UPI000594DD68
MPLTTRTESPFGAIEEWYLKRKENNYLEETRSTETKEFKEARQPGAERTVYVSTGLRKLTQKFAGQRASELAPIFHNITQSGAYFTSENLTV